MEILERSGLLVAVAAFATVVLGVLSLALLWEGLRAWWRRRSMTSELERISRRSRPDDAVGSLLREGEKKAPDWLEPVLLRLPHHHDLTHLLEQARVSFGAGTFLLLTVGLAAAFFVALLLAGGRSLFLPLGGAALGAMLPYLYVALERRKRFKRFEEMFPEAIDLLGRAIRAGHAFSTGLKVVADETSDPIAEEFRQVYEEQKFGLPIDDSLLGLSDRITLLDVRIFVTAVLIQMESGGNLAEILDNLSHIIRERFKFRRQLRVHTAHGRMTGIVLAAAPIAAGIGLWTVDSDYMMPLFTEPAGRLLLAAAVLLQFIGFLSIRRIMDIEV